LEPNFEDNLEQTSQSAKGEMRQYRSKKSNFMKQEEEGKDDMRGKGGNSKTRVISLEARKRKEIEQNNRCRRSTNRESIQCMERDNRVFHVQGMVPSL
jgi:hypothetical protein